MVASFKTFSTPLITNDTIPEKTSAFGSQLSTTTQLDSVKKLVPIGFYVVTESGAKKSLKASVDADAYFKKWTLADNALGKMSGDFSLMTLQRNEAIELNISHEVTIKLLSRQLFWANFWKWTAIGATGVLATKMVLQTSF